MLPHLLITQRPLGYMKQAKIVFDWGLLSIIFRSRAILTSIMDVPIVMYEDNVTCIAQI